MTDQKPEQTEASNNEEVRKVDTKELREIIRQEFDAQYQDLPRRDEVTGMIAREVEQVRIETKDLFETRVTPLARQFEAMDKRFDSLERMLTEMIRPLQKNLEQMTTSITNNLHAHQTSFDRLSKRIAANDARLDRIEPVATTNNKMLVGDSDGTPGLRVQVATLATGQGAIRADVGAIKMMLEAEEARRKARWEMVRRWAELSTQPGVLRLGAGLAGLVLSLLGMEIFGGL